MAELNVDDLVQIFVPDNDECGQGDQDPGNRRIALVKEVRGDQLVLKLAGSGNGPARIHAGLVIHLQKPCSSGLLMYRAIVTAVGTETHPSIVIKTLSAGEQVQRRAFFRVPVDLKVRYRKLDDAKNWFPASLRDLSETGACLVTRESRVAGDKLVLELPVAQQTVCVNGEVRRCWSENRPGGGFYVGIAFADNDENRTDKVRALVYEQQRKMRRRAPAAPGR